MRRILAVAMLALATLALLAAPASGAREPTGKERRLQEALDRLTSEVRGGPPGASVLLQRGGRETFLRSGVADVLTRTRFSPMKHMRIASTSKAFSGAVALRLVDQGLLSLDDTIGERLPGLAPKWDAVTLRQVLSHTGGLPNFTTDPDFLAYFSEHITESDITIPELVEFVADQDLRFTPGTDYEYSNTDNLIVALFAEQATGSAYTDLLESEVFEPVGLERTFLPTGTSLPFPRIEGYDIRPLEELTECCAMAFVSASGGLYSTPRELASFMRAYAGGKLFGAAVRAEQFAFAGRERDTSEPPGPGRNAAGLGVFRYRTRCGTVFGHTGNFPGYTQFAATNRSGTRALSFSVNRQLAPDAAGVDAPQAFEVLRRDYALAVCALLG